MTSQSNHDQDCKQKMKFEKEFVKRRSNSNEK